MAETTSDLLIRRITDDLNDPQPIPRATDYASTIDSDVPIVVQHTRLDSRQSENALITTIVFADTD